MLVTLGSGSLPIFAAIRRASSTEPHFSAWSVEGKIAEPLTACTGVRCQWGERRDLTGTRRFLRRLQQLRQLRDIRRDAPSLKLYATRLISRRMINKITAPIKALMIAPMIPAPMTMPICGNSQPAIKAPIMPTIISPISP
jgi:hypothetical protein